MNIGAINGSRGWMEEGIGGLGWRAGQRRMKDDGWGWSNGNDEWLVSHER